MAFMLVPRLSSSMVPSAVVISLAFVWQYNNVTLDNQLASDPKTSANWLQLICADYDTLKRQRILVTLGLKCASEK